jgi:hypothetical protein
MKSLDFLKEGFVEDATDVHLDHEVQMAREECYHAAEHALAIHKLLRNVSEQQGLEGWVSSKITLANDYLNTVREHLEYELLQGNANDIDSLAIGMPIAETSDYARRREREEAIISGKKPARKRAPAQTSDYAKRREKEKNAEQGVAEGRRDARYHQVYGDPGENPNMRRNDYTVRDLRYGSRTYYNVPPDQEDLARKLHMIQDKEGKWFLPDFPNLSTDDTLQLLGTADSYFGRGEYFPAKRFMEPAWQTESKNTKARALAEWRKAERVKRMKEQTQGGITDDEIRQRIQPKFQATDTQLNDPEWMKARGLIPMQDIERDYQQTLAAEKTADAARQSAKPNTQSYGVNETTAGSVAGVVNPTSNKPKSKIGSLFGGTYKQPKSGKKK